MIKRLYQVFIKFTFEKIITYGDVIKLEQDFFEFIRKYKKNIVDYNYVIGNPITDPWFEVYTDKNSYATDFESILKSIIKKYGGTIINETKNHAI